MGAIADVSSHGSELSHHRRFLHTSNAGSLKVQVAVATAVHAIAKVGCHHRDAQQV